VVSVNRQRGEDWVGHIDGLVLRVELLAEPCLWYWEIRDAADGRLVESSWAGEWAAFPSRTEAAAAGAGRRAEVAATGSAVRVKTRSRRPGRRIVAEPARRAG
jgi:hypothetical protein